MQTGSGTSKPNFSGKHESMLHFVEGQDGGVQTHLHYKVLASALPGEAATSVHSTVLVLIITTG